MLLTPPPAVEVDVSSSSSTWEIVATVATVAAVLVALGLGLYQSRRTRDALDVARAERDTARKALEVAESERDTARQALTLAEQTHRSSFQAVIVAEWVVRIAPIRQSAAGAREPPTAVFRDLRVSNLGGGAARDVRISSMDGGVLGFEGNDGIATRTLSYLAPNQARVLFGDIGPQRVRRLAKEVEIAWVDKFGEHRTSGDIGLDRY